MSVTHGADVEGLRASARELADTAQALLTATANAGPLVGERLGQIAPGYLADLVVLDGDPTVDIRVLLNRDRIGGVVKGGVPATAGWGAIERWSRSRVRP